MIRSLYSLQSWAAASVVIPALLLVACGDDEAARPPDTVLGALGIPRRLRRLSSREYNNVVADLLGITSRPADVFVPDVFPNGYDNGAVGLAVQSDQALQYQLAAEALAETAVTTAWDRLAPGCDPGQRTDEACFDAFASRFAPRAYRRPLTDSERDRLRAAYRAGAAGGAGPIQGVETALEVVLQSPQFLYREELGPTPSGGGGTAPGTVALTDHEVASQLSFLLTGSIPDQALWAAVQAGTFRTAADRRVEAERLLATPAAAAQLRGFLHQWFTTDQLDGLTKDARVYPAFSAALAASMKGELDRFFDDTLAAPGGSLRELFTSRRSFVDQRLAALYGVTGGGGTSADEFAPTLLDDRRRGGVLARAGYLAVHADADSSGPIARGVFLMQALLCTSLPPPPPDVPPAPRLDDPASTGLTTRQRFARHVRDPACRACHEIIDGFGFGFEEFDGIGVARQQESGQPVDASGVVSGTGDADGAYSGLSALAARLSGSQQLLDCFTRQSYRFAMGDVEPAAFDRPAMRRLAPSFSAERRLSDLLLAVIADPGFATRQVEEGTGP